MTTSSASSPGSEPSAERTQHPIFQTDLATIIHEGWEEVASGYAAVWARENTREALFDAMMRQGDLRHDRSARILVRFFGGWDFEPGDAETRRPAVVGYAQGRADGRRADAERRRRRCPDVPGGRAQGSDRRQPGSRPDRQGLAGRERRAAGEASTTWPCRTDARSAPTADGKLTAVGNTVDVANATWTNTIGDPELLAVWEDPDFDPSQRSFYLRPRARDPDAALDRLRRQVLRGRAARRHPHGASGARLHVADLVHAVAIGGDCDAWIAALGSDPGGCSVRFPLSSPTETPYASRPSC